MADKNLSSITAGSKPDGTESLLVKQGANTRRLTLRDVAQIGATIINESTTSRTPTLADVGKYIRCSNGSSITITLNTSVFAAGDELIFEQAGAGLITFAAGAGFTLSSAGALVDSNGQYSVQNIKFLSATAAVLFGNLS